MAIDKHGSPFSLTRRSVLMGTAAAGAAMVGGSMLAPGLIRSAQAAEMPPIGTWPAGSQGSSVFVGITVPRTGTYAAQGEDELKGVQLAIEHINSGDALMKKIAPKTTKGLLGKEVKFGVADSAAKPNNAIAEQTKFINDNKAVLMYGATSSAVAVALNHFAQQQHVLYLVGISGSNDTTGKDCVRYGVRQCFYGETAANAIGPVLLKNFGKGKKAAFMTPDYTYGHTVTKSVNDYLTEHGGWKMVTNQVSPLGTADFSNYLTNIANSGADVLINVNWGRDAVLSIQQAKQFGILPKMNLVIPYQIPFLDQGSRSRDHAGRLCRHRFLVDARGQVPAGQDVRQLVRQEIRLQAGMGRQQRLHAGRLVGQLGRAGRHLLSAGGDQGLRVRPEDPVDRRRGPFPRRRPPTRAAGDHRARQEARRHEEQGGLLGRRRGRARRAALMQKPDEFGCKLGDYT